MQKASPHYRNDDTKGLPENVRQYLDEHFLRELEYLDTTNPKLLVVFSGGNGVGKSTLAQRIKRDLHGLVLENDRIRSCLLAYDPTLRREEVSVTTWRYTMDLYARLPEVTKNGLIVRDGIIDWYYDRILPVFEKQQYPLFIVGFDVSKEKRIELIRKRGDKPTTDSERLITLLREDNDIHTHNFRQHYQTDVILTDDNLFEYDEVLTKLRLRLQQ